MHSAFRAVLVTLVLSFTLPFLFGWLPPGVIHDPIRIVLYTALVCAIGLAIIWPIGLVLGAVLGVWQPRIARFERPTKG